MPAYSDTLRLLPPIYVEIDTVDPNREMTASSSRPVIKILNDNLQDQLTSAYELKKGLKQSEWDKSITNMKLIMTLTCGQYNTVALSQLALGATYKVDHNNGNLINFPDQLRVVCY